MSLGKALIKLGEGLLLSPYMCPSGYMTIGYGRNLDENGVSKREAEFMLENDIQRSRSELEKFAWFKEIDEVRQWVLICMNFNLGLPRFLTFKRMIKALDVHNYELASVEMMQSRWALQVKSRATRLSRMMLTGDWGAEVIEYAKSIK